ncbi:MAG: DUF2461 domain-containing protein [Bacteroidetes bacterium]|nr:DUF2461 domain-containing protein [Bacteroidota bacterium]
MLQIQTINFLKILKIHNNKIWFDKNRRVYENAKTDFETLIQQVIDKHAKKDASLRELTAKDCIFRINRDIRFTKDKTPYKSNFGASINAKGKNAWDSAGYYFHLEPDASFVGGGLYMPPKEVLYKVRQEVDYNFSVFNKIVTSRKFVSMFGGLDNRSEFSLTRLPKGYTPDNPASKYLKLKSFIVSTHISDKELIKPDLVKTITTAFEALQPLLYFLNETLKKVE